MKVLIFKAWYVACAIFCILSLQTLVDERYEVKILAANRSKTDTISLICKELNSFQLNRTVIRLKELREKLFNHSNRLKVPSFYGLDMNPYKRSILNRLKIGQYYIFNGQLCIPLKDSEKYFMSLILTQSVFFAFKNSTLDFAKVQDSFDQLIVKKRGPPYSNCSESNGRFLCLNKCFMNKSRLSRYFYGGNETGLIYLSSSTNQTIESSCFKKCRRENCEIVQLIPFSESRKAEITIFEAQPKLSQFYFWVQFIGLVCSFANVSLNQLASMTIGFANSKVKRRKVRIAWHCLKWAILFLSLLCCGYLYTTMFFDHLAEKADPPRKEIARNLIKQKTVRLAICVDIRQYLTSKYALNLNDLNKSMSEIENATDGALDDLKGIYINYQERMFRMDHIPEPKALFKKFLSGRSNSQYYDVIYRCFIFVIIPEYQLMSSNPKLTIKFKASIPSDHKFYVLAENECFNQKTFEYTAKRAIMKRVVKRLKQGGRCFNYQERDMLCMGEMNYIESCINREAFEKFKKIVIDKAVVDKGQFSSEEWNTTYAMEFLPSNPGPNHTTYKNISSRCSKKFQDQQPCVEVTFSETVEIVSTSPKRKEIDLYLDVELSIEEFTWFNLLLNILNIQSIFFGMTVLKLLRMLYSFFKPKLRLSNDRIIQFLIYLLCSLGFTWHTYRIFDLTINGELIYNPNYEIVNRTQMPMVVFCLPVDEKLIDKNHQLTGTYLEQMTNDITSANLFENITYLDESSEWAPFNLSRVKRFFLMHFKCFNITIDQEYNRRQFHFSANSLVGKVLKVNFTKKFIDPERKKKTVFLMTKTNETTTFSNVVNLFYDHSSYNSLARYSVEQNELTVNYEDRFSFMKRFLSTSYEDDFNDLDVQMPELKDSRLNFKTLKIPLKNDDFDFELRDDLFEQPFTQIMNETARNLLNNLNYEQTFVSNQLKKDPYSDSSFTFSLSLIKKTLSAKNEENFAKLVLNLLNVLFIWFDLGILDLHPIFILAHDYLLVYLYLHWPLYLFEKITQFLFFSHRWLKKFEKPLYKRLNARRLRVPRTRF